MGQQAPPPKAPPPQQPPPPPWQPHFDSNGGLLHQQQQQQLQHGQFYAQRNQGWCATHQQQHAPGQVEKSGQEEDWASKARAWASAKSAQDARHSVPNSLSAPALTLDGGVQVPSSLQVPQDNPNGVPQGPYPYPHELQQQYLQHATLDASQQMFHGAPASWRSVSPGIAYHQAGSSQLDQSLHHPIHPIQSPHMFSRPQGPIPGYQPRGPFPFGGTPPIVPIVMDTSAERPRKTAVPTWLRDELKKKAAAPPVLSFPDGATKRNGTELETTSFDGIPNSSGGSDTEVDDEDAVETVKTTIINQEIKRLLTEVLLKVTDGLFNEIAQEILNEESHGKKADSDKLRSSTAGPARVVVAAGDGQEAELNTTGAGNLLGLASYDSEDDTAEGESKNVNKIGREERSVNEDSEQEGNDKKRRPQEVLNSLEHSQAENHRNIERKDVVDEIKEDNNVDYSDKERKKDKQRNKENEGDLKLKDKGSIRSEHRHRDIKDNRSERRRDRKKKHRPSLSRSPSSRRRSRSNSTDSPRRRKLHERRRRSRSRSPKHHRRESPRSRSRSPREVSPSPSRERRRHRHSRSRSPAHRPRKR